MQRFYIKSIEFDALTIDSFKSAKSGVICISDLDRIEFFLTSIISFDNSMFLSTWSISESPMDFRNSILYLITQFNAFLIAHQGQFENNNNIEFFKKWITDQNEVKCNNYKIGHIPNNY